MTAVLARARAAWNWLWNCTRPSRPPATLTDAYGRRWALWCDGAWVDPAAVETTARVQLLERLAASPYTPVMAGPVRRRRPRVVRPVNGMDTVDLLNAVRGKYGPVDPWSPAARLAAGPCAACANGLHGACTGTRVVGSHWRECACGCTGGRP